MFQGCFKEVSRVFQGCFKGVSRKFQGCFKGVLRKFQGCFKEVSRVFKGSFKNISREFQGCFTEVARGGVKIEKRENLGHVPIGGGWVKKTEMSQFQFGNFENPGGGSKFFQKCRELKLALKTPSGLS